MPVMFFVPEHRCTDCGGILLEDDAVVHCGCCGAVAIMRPASPQVVAEEMAARILARKEKEKETRRWSSAPPMM